MRCRRALLITDPPLLLGEDRAGSSNQLVGRHGDDVVGGCGRDPKGVRRTLPCWLLPNKKQGSSARAIRLRFTISVVAAVTSGVVGFCCKILQQFKECFRLTDEEPHGRQELHHSHGNSRSSP